MANQISPMAYVHPDAKLGDNNIIGPFCYIDADVVIGDNNVMQNSVTLNQGTRMGSNNEIFPGASISTKPQDLKFKGEITTCEIGDNNSIRENVTISRGTFSRDFGCFPAANSSFLLNLGLETLAVRMKQYCENAKKVAEFISKSDKVQAVAYPGLEGDKYYERAKKYLPLGTCGVISVSIKGGRDNAVKFMDSLKLASNEVHVADIRTCVLHPASATHRQLTDEQLAAAGIDGGLIRLSVGLENVDDIIADVERGLAAID